MNVTNLNVIRTWFSIVWFHYPLHHKHIRNSQNENSRQSRTNNVNNNSSPHERCVYKNHDEKNGPNGAKMRKGGLENLEILAMTTVTEEGNNK